MGYILDDCPVVHSCCCVPLRAGTFVIGVIGLVGAGGFLWVCADGARRIGSSGAVGPSLLKPVRYFCGASGVLLAAVHAFLIAAAIYESDSLCEVYIWFMVVWSTLLCVFAIGVTTQAALDNFEVSAFIALAVGTLLMVVAFLAVLIVANYRMTIP